MNHYRTLGVSPRATAGELRQAYLQLVRDHHPDRHAESPPDVRAASEERMRAANEAWNELGDPQRRARYDELLDMRPSGAFIEPDHTSSWRPIDEGDDVVDARLDDTHRPAPRGGRLLVMGPPAVLCAGIVVLVIGFAIGLRTVVAFGAMGVILGGALFVVASLSVVAESRQNDLR